MAADRTRTGGRRLLWLLNTDRTPAQRRKRAFPNIALALCALAFAALAVNEIRKAIALI